jgi:DNA-binding LacI/PurR family transcriptional regulator
MKATLQGVAATAGVSISTVSRYLKGELSLRPDTEEKVLDAIRHHNYAPHRASGTPNLPRVHTSVLGILVPDIGNPYFAAAASEVAQSARELNYSTLIASARNAAHLGDDIRRLRSLPVDGIVCIGNLALNSDAQNFLTSGIPVVAVAEEKPGFHVDTVVADDYAGAYQAASYLCSLGHKRIAFVGGPKELRSSSQRERGWRDALSRAGADPDSPAISGTYGPESGAAALSRLLALPDRPTAIFAAGDIIALGMLGAARNLGISIPEDMSVIGFDNVPAAAIVTPRLTTITTPLATMARAALTLLTARMEDPDREAVTEVMPVAFVHGQSAGAPRR